MSYLSGLINDLRKRVSVTSRLEDSGSRDLPVVFEETPSRHVEITSREFIKTLNVKPLRPQGELYALDSSSRVVETPYLFLGIGAGSIFSRFTGRGIDVPSPSSLLGLEKPLCKHILLIPGIEVSEQEWLLLDIPGVLTKNPLGKPYTSSYNKQLALGELRISLENCILSIFNSSNLAVVNNILLVDGPLIYPKIRVFEHIEEAQVVKTIYSESIEYLNKERVEVLREIMNRGVLVAGVVKRLMRSYYLSSIDPFGIAMGLVSDETYLYTLINTRNPEPGKPVVVGPIRVKHEIPNAPRIMWYLAIPRRLHPVPGRMGNYLVFRVEVFESSEWSENDILGYIVYDSLYMGGLLPLSILITDKRVKKITSSITSYLLYTTGLSEESTSQYISVL